MIEWGDVCRAIRQRLSIAPAALERRVGAERGVVVEIEADRDIPRGMVERGLRALARDLGIAIAGEVVPSPPPRAPEPPPTAPVDGLDDVAPPVVVEMRIDATPPVVVANPLIPWKARIRALRGRLGETHRQFGKRFGYSKKAIESWEYGYSAPGRHAIPIIEALERDSAPAETNGADREPIAADSETIGRLDDTTGAIGETPDAAPAALANAPVTDWSAYVTGLRRRLNWTHKQLALAVHTGIGNIGRWERGEDVPQPRHQHALLEIDRGQHAAAPVGATVDPPALPAATPTDGARTLAVGEAAVRVAVLRRDLQLAEMQLRALLAQAVEPAPD